MKVYPPDGYKFADDNYEMDEQQVRDYAENLVAEPDDNWRNLCRNKPLKEVIEMLEENGHEIELNNPSNP